MSAESANRGFAFLVSLAGEPPERHPFDRDRVVVGRGADADLRIEHAAVSRVHFLVERRAQAAGGAAFRIQPFTTRNATLVNDRPAESGVLAPGDVIAIGDVRVALEKPAENSRRTLVLAGACVMALAVLGIVYLNNNDAPVADLAGGQDQLFAGGADGDVGCDNPIECDTRAHEAYARGRKWLSQAGADPGGQYRAAQEFEKAARFRRLSGRTLPDIGDVGEQLGESRRQAEMLFHDALFRYSRAKAQGDLRRQADEIQLLARLIPDERHPLRARIESLRRQLPKPRGAGMEGR